jgi:hypothetical protein
MFAFCVSYGVPSATFAVSGVGQPASCACLGNWSSLVRSDPSGFVAVVAIPALSFQSLLAGVTLGDASSCCVEEEALADVRSTDARSA